MTSGKLKGQGAAVRLAPGQAFALAERNLARMLGGLRDVADRVHHWRQRRRVRRWVETLDERALKDIGLTHADVWQETGADWYRL